jgi:hypothetical protein
MGKAKTDTGNLIGLMKPQDAVVLCLSPAIGGV